MKHSVVSIVLLVVAALPAGALAQPTVPPVLNVTAFSGAKGPTVGFGEGLAGIRGFPPALRRMDVGRPRRVSVATPPAGASLGSVHLLIGDPLKPTTRRIALRRRVALGGGRYSLARSAGVRVVLSTRSTDAFITIALSPPARFVRVGLTGRGAHLLSFGNCTSRVFTAHFVTASGRIIRDAATMAMSSLRRARLCSAASSASA